MTVIYRLARVALITTLAGAAGWAAAQGTSSPAKKELVQKALALQQPGIESIGAGLANQTANQVLQVAGQAMARVPAEKREALGADLKADVQKFFDEVSPTLRAAAVKNAPATIGAAMEEKFNEDELKVLVAWLDSPVSRKFQQMSAELQQSLAQKLIAETRPQIEPKLKALEQTMAARFKSATGENGAAAPKPANSTPPKK